jgi:hypothetical protein
MTIEGVGANDAPMPLVVSERATDFVQYFNLEHHLYIITHCYRRFFELMRHATRLDQRKVRGPGP